MVKRRRNQLNLAPPNPADASKIVIPDEYKQYMTNNGERENFLIADSGQSDDKILIFERKCWTKYLLDSDVWYADGTFKLAPPLFTKVYVILAKKMEESIQFYMHYYQIKGVQHTCACFSYFITKFPLNPRAISCDFE